MIGKCIFPVIVDPNKHAEAKESGSDTSLVVQDSAAIVDYLWKQYGAKLTPISKSSMAFLFLPVIFRPLLSMGVMRTPSKCPNIPLELYSYEHEPACRIIREVGILDFENLWLFRPCSQKLDSLELPYILHSMPIGAKFREREYMARFQTDKVILPRLVDPNVLVAVAETSDLKASVGSDIKAPLNLTDTQSILHHLTDTYAIGEVISYFVLMMKHI
jgi:hypothetical protein